MMGTRIRREFTGLFSGSLGLIEAFALVWIASAPPTAMDKDDRLPSWKVTRFVLETGLYVAEIPSDLIDAGDAGCDQCAVRSRPLADFFRQSKASGSLDATGGLPAAMSTRIRLAPKRSPPASPSSV